MKYCKYCNEEKSINDFRERKGTTRSNRCSECQREYSKNHYKLNREQYAKRNQHYQRGIKLEVLNFLNEIKSKPCMDCGISYPPYVMDFDHRDREEKKLNVSAMVFRRFSLNSIKEEIAKCDLVCANCHRIRTYKVM